MEFFLFLAVVFVLAIFYLWRSRVRTSNDLESRTKGLPDDLRDKNTGSIGISHGGASGGGFGDGGGSGGG
jgi:cbb3-type cytochrome oxidase subunit 3